jgi:hypothetical protein
MTGFRFCYNLNKHAPDQDSNLGRTNLVGRCSFWASGPDEYLWYRHIGRLNVRQHANQRVMHGATRCKTHLTVFL